MKKAREIVLGRKAAGGVERSHHSSRGIGLVDKPASSINKPAKRGDSYMLFNKPSVRRRVRDGQEEGEGTR